MSPTRAIAGQARMIQDLSVRLLNVSASGCLLESDRRVNVGSQGALRVVLQGRELTEPIVVVRCQPLQGAGTRCLVGARFAPPEGPSASPLLSLLSTIDPEQADLQFVDVSWKG